MQSEFQPRLHFLQLGPIRVTKLQGFLVPLALQLLLDPINCPVHNSVVETLQPLMLGAVRISRLCIALAQHIVQ